MKRIIINHTKFCRIWIIIDLEMKKLNNYIALIKLSKGSQHPKENSCAKKQNSCSKNPSEISNFKAAKLKIDRFKLALWGSTESVNKKELEIKLNKRNSIKHASIESLKSIQSSDSI